ncbi:Stp1/IreP family PP2C-type Ser/Thr phosphatase [Microbulbifer magnicolonia]|uniref:Stp1/IreP family PP2C-type Ser/Thr phosphatase n=1 Tax=Microbulbifer magnicolonia TaxID=3109744 RepID=UPI002B4062FB|nr:Stp1/IreP family PP2C-type Ser/Thr phosphatase [Microbulbifer sp. GG15]
MGSIRLEVNGRSDVGQVRDENEDNILWHKDPKFPFAYLIVADGMGGYSGGAIASQIAVDTLHEYLNALVDKTFLSCSERQRQHILRAVLIDAIGSANCQILDTKNNQPQFSQMGTTLVAAAVWQDFLIVAHIGDSRAYLWNNHGLQRLTSDHSVVQELIDCGQITPEQAQVSQIRNQITRALGVSRTVDPVVSSWYLTDDTVLLLCSDGLTDYLDDNTIERFLASRESARSCAYRLVEHANCLGGRDNITAGILEFSANAQLDLTNPDPTFKHRPQLDDLIVRTP